MSATATIEVTVELDTRDPDAAHAVAITLAERLDALPVVAAGARLQGVTVTDTTAEAARVLTRRTEPTGA